MHSRKVVLQFIDSLYRGGAQKVVLDIVRALPKCSHIVCYWTDEEDLKPEFLKENVLLIRLSFSGIVSLPITYFHLLKTIREYKPDYVHTHMFVPNVLARLQPSKEFKIISTYHGECFEQIGWKGWLMRWCERSSLTRADVLIAVSNYIKTYVEIKLNLVGKATVRVIHNSGETESQTNEYSQPSLPIRLVATSNNQPYKGYPLLLEVMAMFPKEVITLDIYGSGMEPLKKMAESLSIDNIVFCGVIPNVSSILKNYSAYIACSNSGEGFSLSMLEAMSAGLPIICTDIPQFVEAVGESAIIFKKSETENLKQKLTSLLKEPIQLIELARASHERSKLFSRNEFERKIQEIYSN